MLGLYEICIVDLQHASELQLVTESFPVEIGLHQGSALISYLFALIMDDIYCETQEGTPWCMLFDDDMLLMAESRVELNARLDTWKTSLEEKGFISTLLRQHSWCNFSGEQNIERIKVCIDEHVLHPK